MTATATKSRDEAVRLAALSDLLERKREAVIDQATLALGYSNRARDEASEIGCRLAPLYDHVVCSAASRDLGPVVSYAHQLANEAYRAGESLAELQTAFNALEEALWKDLVEDLPPDQVTDALALVSTVFGVAKDTVACFYVAAASRTRAHSLDLESLAAGAGSASGAVERTVIVDRVRR
jgi:hypothetical protein